MPEGEWYEQGLQQPFMDWLVVPKNAIVAKKAGIRAFSDLLCLLLVAGGRRQWVVHGRLRLPVERCIHKSAV